MAMGFFLCLVCLGYLYLTAGVEIDDFHFHFCGRANVVVNNPKHLGAT